ncbi:4a-hydroxytetrahydrobiopterin dehydratase [Plastorhodobacter daqingensis]|uniref:Putative pterin-4-alpha-carbinolamine dehydratase n=1 Tax=Plastorhodobacter daqingensis TaxID=1387281 RepID=A0ABW2UFP3_9RHOB
MTTPASEESRRRLAEAGWATTEGRDAITKTFRFATFRAAFAWMTEIALWAERLNHHPEWRNVYNRVDVTLTTHDAGGLTDLDAELARRMDEAQAARTT